MSFTPEDLGFSRSYTIDMVAPSDLSPDSSTPSTGTSTPAENVFGSSTVSSTASSFGTLQRRTTDLGPQGNASNPLPHHGRPFPKPAESLDMGEALSRPPKPWSIQGQIEANRRREEQNEARKRSKEAQDSEQEKRRQDLARVKAELLAMKADIATKASRGAP